MNFPTGLFSTEKCLYCKRNFWENSFQFAVRKINTAAASPPSWKILIDFSSAAVPRSCGGKSLSVLPQCVKGDPRRPSLCQPSKWAADILKHLYCNSPATELWKQFLFFCGKYQGFTSLPHPKQTIFQTTDTFLESFIFQNKSSKFQTMRSVQNNSDFCFQPVPLSHFAYLDLLQQFSFKDTFLVQWEKKN